MNKLCLLLLCCIILFKATSQPGSLDSTFGNNGVQTTTFFSNVNNLYEQGREVLTSANGDIFIVVQIAFEYTRIVRYLPDGRLDSSYGSAGYSDAVEMDVTSAVMQGDKIIVAGGTKYYNTFNQEFALARYTADGMLDSSFGVNGKVTTTFQKNSADGANSIVLQGNKIVVGGGTYNYENGLEDFALARYTANGVLDSSFGVNGKVITDIGYYYDYANSIALQGDKILAAGYTATKTSDFALVRYTANGVLDSSFGENGIVKTDFNNSQDEANSITLQGNKIVVGGSSNGDFALARYTAEGALDPSFGQNGKVITTFQKKSSDGANSIALQGDKIVVGGSTVNSVNYNADFALARFTAEGALDSSFGENGIVKTDFNASSYDLATSIVLQGGKIIQAGSSNYSDFALARYTANGKLDDSFGENGLLTGYFPSTTTYFTSTVIQENKVVAAGYALNNSNNSDFALARYTADGALDTSFGVNGKLTTDFNNSSDVANSIVLQGDKIVVGGSTRKNTSDFALARYTAEGVLDSSFGVNGLVTTQFDKDAHDYVHDYVNSIALQGDKIVVAGYSVYNDYSSSNIALARYTGDGALDSSFGVNGKVTTNFRTNSWDVANVIALQGDKIVVGGSTGDYPIDFALIRYTADGRLDSSFGENGKVKTDFGGPFDAANSIAIQGDSIIVAGGTGDYPNYDFALARYTADGALDTSFGVNGKVTTDFNNSSDVANSIVLQGDKILTGGSSMDEFALARYTANGALDSSFGKNGKVITHLGGSASIHDIALDQNRLYAAGSTFQSSNTYGIVAAYQLETPEPTIAIADVTVQESKRFAVVTIRLSAPATKRVVLHFAARSKTAVQSQDYIGIAGPVIFIPQLNQQVFKIPVPIIDDNTKEGDEQFEIVLSHAHNATIQDSIGVVTIMDDDDALITKQNASLRIHAFPNPYADVFTVQLQSSNLKQPASIRVYDVSGRLIEEINNISIGQSLRLGHQYTAGTYIIEAVQGYRRVQTKVAKTGK